MDFFSHVLWAFVLFRNKLWRDEALLFAILPDVGFVFILFYVFNSPHNFARAIYYMPKEYLVIYNLFHSFVILGLVALAVWKLRPKLLPALSGWFVHIMIDIPVHDGTFGTRFLYPLFPDVYFSGISWADIRVQAISYIALIIVYVYSVRRERKKHVQGKAWKRDWIDKINEWGDGLIRRKRIRVKHEAGHGIGRAPGEISGEDGTSADQDNDQPAGEVGPQEDGRGFL